MSSVPGLALSRSGAMDRLRIAVIAHLKYPIAEPFSGGLEMHTHILATKLAERGHHVTLFAATGSDCGNVSVVCHPTSQLETDPVLAQTIDSIEQMAYADVVAAVQLGAFDVVHFNALHYLPLGHADTFNAPMVVALHTPPFAPLDAAVAAAAAKDHVACVAVSASLTEAWTSLNETPMIIGNGIDLARFPFKRPADDDVFAVWSGRIVPEKGLHLAIDAARLAGVPLKIAGPISNRAYWDAEIAPRLTAQTTYLGHLAQEDLAALVGMATVAVCTPRWEEPFGLVVAEALACGTPVAGFARGALPDILDATSGALAPSDDVEGLARAIKQCLSLDRRACRSRAEFRFDVEVMIDHYESLYREMVSARALVAARGSLIGEDA
jgi:UDP-glucose:tetrahydrobiopterin glucosyltransferase